MTYFPITTAAGRRNYGGSSSCSAARCASMRWTCRWSASPSLDPVLARAEHVLTAMGGQRLRTWLRRAVAARRPGRRPAGPTACLPRGPGRVRAGLRARRPGEQPRPADRGPVRQGRGGGVHRAGQHVAAHHHVPRGPDAQPRVQHLHRLRGERFLAGAGPVRRSHRDQLAVDAAGIRAGRGRGAGRRAVAHPALGSAPGGAGAGSTYPAP